MGRVGSPPVPPGLIAPHAEGCPHMTQHSDTAPLDLTIGILTWNAPNTFRNTLESYEVSGLLRYSKETLVFLQGDNPAERRIARQYGLHILASEYNVGIEAAIKRLASTAGTEYFLFLENDWVCVESPRITRQRLREAVALLRGDVAQCVRLRHKHHYGEPLHTLQFKGKERNSPQHFLDCIHWVAHPEKKFPDIFTVADVGKGNWIITDSRYANYTNNPCVYHTEFLRSALKRHANPELAGEECVSQQAYAAAKGVSPSVIALEGNIQSWWREQRFSIVQGEGLFRHSPQWESNGFVSSVKRTLKRLFRDVDEDATPRASEAAPQIAFVCAHRETDIASVPLSVAREFERRGWQVRFFSLFDERDAYHDGNVRLLYRLMQRGWYRPDIVFHLDYTGFRSRYFAKINRFDIFTVFESADDPKRFTTNYPKAKNFDLVLTPDYSSMETYRRKGYHALWWTHFADDTVCKSYAVPEVHAVVSTRGRGSSDIMDRLADEHPELFVNRTGLHGERHAAFLCNGKIVLQHSRDQEITRRIFEGMASGRLVLADRLPAKTHIDDLFTENEDIVYYDGYDDCVKKIYYYISPENDAAREAIAINGYAKTMAHHTQQRRVAVILEEYARSKK